MTCLHITTKPTKANLDPNGGNKQFSALNRGELQVKTCLVLWFPSSCRASARYPAACFKDKPQNVGDQLQRYEKLDVTLHLVCNVRDLASLRENVSVLSHHSKQG